MNYAALLASSVFALVRNKMRSLLTVLGITIGIAAVICVVAIGKAGQARVEQQLSNLGDNFVWIEAGGRAVNGVRTGTHATPRSDARRRDRDQEPDPAHQERLAERRRIRCRSSTATRTGTRAIAASRPSTSTSSAGRSAEGAVFTSDDVDRAADVCVIGRTVRDQLFGAANPIGKVDARAGSAVQGRRDVLQPKGLSVSGQDQDDTIILPYTTAQKKIKGAAWLDDILCSAVSPER